MQEKGVYEDHLESQRKRRRQLYKVRAVPKREAKSKKLRGRAYRGKAKKDETFEAAVKDARKTVCIHDKLMAVSYYETLLEEKRQAKQTIMEPRPRKMKRSEQVALREKKEDARKVLKRCLQKQVQDKFSYLKGSQICKWYKRSKLERWEEIPDAIRKSATSTGNSWCSKIGISLRGRQQGGSYPWALQKELDILIGEMSLGASSVSERREVVTAECIARTAESLVHDWNASLAETRERIAAHNKDAIERHKAGEIHPGALPKMIEPLPRPLTPPTTSWCQWFCVAWGWGMYARSCDSQAWLPYDHADMQASRQSVQSLIDEGCHGGMILNYDQIWRNSFCTSKLKVPFKKRDQVGKRSRRVRANPQFDKKSHPVKGSRQSVTVLTSVWSSGHAGPLAFCIKEGALSREDIEKWNREHIGRSFVVSSGSNTHFMNAEVWCQILEQMISPCIRIQKQRLGLDPDDFNIKGALLSDAWTGSFSTSRGYDVRRSQWFATHNFCAPRQNPGGWSSHGQPVDQIHGAYRQHTRKADLRSIFEGDLRDRPRFEQLDLKASGQVVQAVRPLVDIMDISLSCWDQLGRKTFESSWIVCGYFGPAHFEQFRGTDAGVGSFDEAVGLADPAGVLSGSSLCHTPQYCSTYEWQIQDSKGDFQALPYEIAHGVVRSLRLHSSELRGQKNALANLEAGGAKKAKIDAVKEKIAALQSMDRFVVFNRSTGVVATNDWLSRHVTADSSGRPVLKNPQTKAKPWIMVVRIELNGLDMKVSLKENDSESTPFRVVRCFDLTNGASKGKTCVLDEYPHLLDDDFNEKESIGSMFDKEDDLYEESLPGDAEGLEGQEVNVCEDPAPAPEAGSDEPNKHLKATKEMQKNDFEAEAADLPVLPPESECDFCSVVADKGVATEPPQAFRSRPVYMELEAAGLTKIPPMTGCGIFLHRSTWQWHARYGHCQEMNTAPTWSPTLRSERKALLIALAAMWRWFADETKSACDAEYVARLETARDETTF